jgi:ubiquinone/menaquinone biosynthesis C-methylase UbiE
MRITYQKYQQHAKEAIDLGGHKVLKTDTWNEIAMNLPIKADAYLELDSYRVQRALSSGYNTIQGDIRQIPFPDGEFGTVIDLSTIDHIPDYEKAIQEYHRVLKNGGIVLIVAWLSTWRLWPTEANWGGKQYYFKAGEFRDAVEKYFEIIREQDFPEFTGDKFLYGFSLKKE